MGEEEFENTDIEKENDNKDFTFSTSSKGVMVCDDEAMTVECSRGPAGDKKSNCCFYCHKMQTKITRNLETVHRNEKEVRNFRVLPKGNSERRKIIATLRKMGNFEYNRNPDYNTGKLLVARRPRSVMNREAIDFAPCPNC